MRTLVTLLFSIFCLNAYATLPDLTGNYTGCGVSSSLGKSQAVMVLVKMPTGFGPDDFTYSGGFYWRGSSADFFADVKIDDKTGRILMKTQITPLHDFGVIVKTVDAQINADGSITGRYLTNSTGEQGEFQNGTWTVNLVHANVIPSLVCD